MQSWLRGCGDKKVFKEKYEILDCAAGTGAYAFYLADKGHKLTATDISCFLDASFDVILNMEPFYHLIDEKARKKCLEESLRVLKKGGYFVVAYIPRLYLNQMIAMLDVKYVDEQFDTWKNFCSDYRIIAPSPFGYLGSDVSGDGTPANMRDLLRSCAIITPCSC